MIKVLLPIFLLLKIPAFGSVYAEHKQLYQDAFNEIKLMLEGKQQYSFKRAVFVTENAYLQGRLNYSDFNNEIKAISSKLKNFVVNRNIQQNKIALNYAAFAYMMDSISENGYKPYAYDFSDFLGNENFENMFVSKLMGTKAGNCHSLPYFYKILCDEVGAEAFLAVAPNHCYVKHKDAEGKWVNIELTNASSPRDQWIIQQMHISSEAIRTGAYMKPLNKQEALALCLFDLTMCYKLQFGFDDFYFDIVNEGLKYYPNSIELTMEKANYYGSLVMKAKELNSIEEAKYYYELYMEADKRIGELGYQEETPEQYAEWVQSVEEEKAKRAKLENK